MHKNVIHRMLDARHAVRYDVVLIKRDSIKGEFYSSIAVQGPRCQDHVCHRTVMSLTTS